MNSEAKRVKLSFSYLDICMWSYLPPCDHSARATFLQLGPATELREWETVGEAWSPAPGAHTKVLGGSPNRTLWKGGRGLCPKEMGLLLEEEKTR